MQILALRIWEEAVDQIGALAEAYLRGRGLKLEAGVSHSVIRFHPECPNGALRLPALVALDAVVLRPSNRKR